MPHLSLSDGNSKNTLSEEILNDHARRSNSILDDYQKYLVMLRDIRYRNACVVHSPTVRTSV